MRAFRLVLWVFGAFALLLVFEGTRGDVLRAPTAYAEPDGCADISFEGLIGWWKGEENLEDSSGNGNHFQPLDANTSVAYEAGVVGQAVVMSGDDPILLVGEPTAFDLAAGDDFSVDLWFKGTFITGSSFSNLGWFVAVRPGVASGVAIEISANDGKNSAFVRFLLPDYEMDEWHFLAVSVERDTETHLQVFYDGVTYTSDELDDVDGPLASPTGSPGAAFAAAGTWDEIEVFRRALTLEEMQAIYNAGALGKCTGTTLEVRKAVAPVKAPGKFDLLIDGEVEAASVGNGGTTGPVSVAPGTHTISELASAGTLAGNYTTSIWCDGGWPTIGTSATIDVPEGEHMVCTITNELIIPAVCAGMTFDAYLIGTDGPDTLTGTGLRELIMGNSGNDRLSGGAGNDCIVGGTGNDTLNGGSGNDKLFGEAGNDTLNGDSGIDIANGGANTDACDAENEAACES